MGHFARVCVYPLIWKGLPPSPAPCGLCMPRDTGQEPVPPTTCPTGWYLQLQHQPLGQAPRREVAGIEVEHHLEGQAGQRRGGCAGQAGLAGPPAGTPAPQRRGDSGGPAVPGGTAPLFGLNALIFVPPWWVGAGTLWVFPPQKCPVASELCRAATSSPSPPAPLPVPGG